MEDIKEILEMFDTPKKWNAYIELSRMKDVLVNELLTSLYDEIETIYKEKGIEDWNLKHDNVGISLSPKELEDKVAIKIEWKNWQEYLGYERCVGIWINAKKLNVTKFIEEISKPENRHRLPIQDYERIPHDWFPFARKIPVSVFEVDGNIASYEECLFRAIKHPKKLADDLWNDVFDPFATEDSANCLRDIVQTSFQ